MREHIFSTAFRTGEIRQQDYYDVIITMAARIDVDFNYIPKNMIKFLEKEIKEIVNSNIYVKVRNEFIDGDLFLFEFYVSKKMTEIVIDSFGEWIKQLNDKLREINKAFKTKKELENLVKVEKE